MEVLVLAAGRGQRLADAHLDVPKTLVPVCGRPLLHYVLCGLSTFPAARISVVSGFAHEHLDRYLREHWPQVTRIHHSQYTPGNLTTLLSAKRVLEEAENGLLLANADHAYDRTLLATAQAHMARYPNRVAIFCDRDRALTDDDMKVATTASGTLAVMKKTLSSYDAGYIGMSYIPGALCQAYLAHIRQLAETAGPFASVEQVMNQWAAEGQSITLLDVSGHHWFEVDTPEDLVRAEALLARCGDSFNGWQ